MENYTELNWKMGLFVG